MFFVPIIRLNTKKGADGVLLVVFIGECVEVLLFLMYHVLHTLIDRCAAVPDFLQNSLKDDHIANHRMLQHIDLRNTETEGSMLNNRNLNQRSTTLKDAILQETHVTVIKY